MGKMKRGKSKPTIEQDRGFGATLRALFYAAYDNWMDAHLVHDKDGEYVASNGHSDNLRMHLAKLLGYGSFTELVRADPKEYETAIYALAGPHGFTVYKMLLVQRRMNEG